MGWLVEVARAQWLTLHLLACQMLGAERVQRVYVTSEDLQFMCAV